MKPELAATEALTFDLFGTVLDLGGSLTPHIGELLAAHKCDTSPEHFWGQWRARQRIEQYQDNILMLGHSGYQTVARRALKYTLGLNNVSADEDAIDSLMAAWQQLDPFPECLAALERLKSRYRLVALSNGEPEFLEHLARNRIGFAFDFIFSVAVVGAFKPHPGVYRRAAAMLKLPLPQCLMVSANSFDVMGARSCGMRGAFVNRYHLPYEDTEFRPDLEVRNFTELAEALLDE